jgi:tRNA threonylcarbamoyladenosine biosynthesis protein TsaB
VSSLAPLPPEPLILALDTSSSLGSVALARGGTLLKTHAFEADHGHSQRLLPAIEGAFSDAGVAQAEVDLFAVVVGPGSFTGLRVSLASVRGLAGSKPCFGALATDVAAWAARGRGAAILAVTDLFHGEVFASAHDRDGTLLSNRESGDLPLVLSALRDFVRPPAIATGSAAAKHRNEIEAAFPDIEILALEGGLAPHLAGLAAAQASAETLTPAGELLPFYLRDPLTRGLLNSQPRVK